MRCEAARARTPPPPPPNTPRARAADGRDVKTRRRRLRGASHRDSTYRRPRGRAGSAMILSIAIRSIRSLGSLVNRSSAHLLYRAALLPGRQGRDPRVAPASTSREPRASPDAHLAQDVELRATCSPVAPAGDARSCAACPPGPRVWGLGLGPPQSEASSCFCGAWRYRSPLLAAVLRPAHSARPHDALLCMIGGITSTQRRMTKHGAGKSLVYSQRQQKREQHSVVSQRSGEWNRGDVVSNAATDFMPRVDWQADAARGRTCGDRWCYCGTPLLEASVDRRFHGSFQANWGGAHPVADAMTVQAVALPSNRVLPSPSIQACLTYETLPTISAEVDRLCEPVR